jgi:hypothetical protein
MPGTASALGGPVNAIPPSISGSAVQGSVLTCTPGTWAPAPTGYSYSWQRNVTTTIGGASNQYSLTSADVGQAITCTIVATDALGSSLPALSAPVIPVAPSGPLVPAETSPPIITGTAAEGQQVICSQGGWTNSPTNYAYTWQRNGSNIGGQASSGYTLTSNDVNHAVTCTVVASNGSGAGAPAVSAPVVPLSVPSGSVPIDVAPPTITGTAAEGQTVSCSRGSWLNADSYSFTWQRDASNVIGQIGSQYTLTSGDVSQAITCTVVAHNSSGGSLPAISLPIVPTAGVNSPNGGGGDGAGSGAGSGGSGGGAAGRRPGGASKLPAPRITAFSVVPGQMIVSLQGRRQTSKGVTFRYRLDRTAAVVIVVQQRLTGRIKGKTCVAATRRNKKAKHCTRYLMIKTIMVKSAKAGTGQLKYAGRTGRGWLPSSGYRALVAAANAAGWSNARSAGFVVVRKHSKGR